MVLLANLLREPGCGGPGGMIAAGDFNAISSEDPELVDKNNPGKRVGRSARKGDPSWSYVGCRRGTVGRIGADKVEMTGLEANEIEFLPVRPGLIEVPRPIDRTVHIPWSDHCGLRCTFTVEAGLDGNPGLEVRSDSSSCSYWHGQAGGL